MLRVLALLALAATALAAGDGEVKSLTTATFDEVINGNDYVLVEFFAPWCGHCKKLAPEYKKAAEALKGENIILADVDATVEKDLASKYGVRGYPTLKLFKKGQATEYKGGRTEDTIVKYLKKATGPPATTLTDAASVKAFADANKVAVVAFVKDESDLKAFETVAAGDEDNVYGFTYDAAAATANDVTAPAIVLFKQFDEGKNVFDGAIESAAIKAFVEEKSTPLVIPFSMDVVGKIFQSSVGKVAFLLSNTDAAYLKDIATEFKGKLVFTIADSSNPRLNQHLGVEANEFPRFLILETAAQMKKYPLEAAPDAASVKAHIEAFLAGNLKPHFKSEKVPANNDGPVTVVVGDNFNDVVLDEKKDVLLEVYAPWCGHCKKLEPIYNELGDAYKNNKNIVIAKMDGTANEVDGLAPRGFPTIKFYPAGSKTAASGKDYSGGRELADFKKYLDANAKSEPAKDEL